MLRSLVIQNYALIESLEIRFDSGMTALTGETGSGKSIVLGALGLILGDRADVQHVRKGSSKCVVEATFQPNAAASAWLDKHHLEQWKELIIRREVSDQGRSRAFVNDTPVNATHLRLLGDSLVDLHGQDSTRLLLQRKYQLELLDAFGSHQALSSSYQSAYHRFRTAHQHVSAMELERSKPQTDQNYLTYQLSEFDELDLAQNDYEALEIERDMLEHSVTIKQHLGIAWNAMDGGEIDGSISDRLMAAHKALAQVATLHVGLQPLVARLDSLLIEWKDISTETEQAAESIEENPNRLASLNQTLDVLQRMLHKHHVATPGDLLQVESELRDHLDQAGQIDLAYDNAQKELESAQLQMRQAGEQLLEARQAASLGFSSLIIQFLMPLKLEKAQLKFEFDVATVPDIHGIENITLCFSANPGASMAPLSAVASGGEKSRLMLAIKAAQASCMATPSIVLDEIDTGVSGEVAEKMAHMMYSMGQRQQVLAVTHLPQVAAAAKHHLRVSKRHAADSTVTEVTHLEGESRILEIAGMLSGAHITEAAQANAQALLDSSNKLLNQ